MSEEIVEVESKENKEEKTKKQKKKGFLPADIRAKLVEQLNEYGVETGNLDDNELLLKQSSLTQGFHSQVVTKETDKMQGLVNQWKGHPDSLLTDEEFIIRLINLSVHIRYAKLFRDNDKNLKADKIWTRIRESGIDPLDGKSLGGILSRQR